MKEQKITENIKVKNNDLEILKNNFSHCFDKSGDFDFDKFKKELSQNEINFSKESYSMDWLGKSYARLLATDNATTSLQEDKEWNNKNKNSQNLLLKGDNLEVLKHLSNAYREQVKMIYIDPPYNTGSDGFVYQDDRKFSVSEFRTLAGVSEEKAKSILNFVDSKSNSHSAWLTFMYPRLYIAKQLLKDDGVIFISIDDNEVAQLRLLMDEIFGEENFVASIIWKRKRGRDNSAKWFSKSHEYILVFSKNKDMLSTNFLELDNNTKKAYKNPDNDIRGIYRMLAVWARGTQSGVKYDFTNKEGKYFGERLWLFSKNNLTKMDNENKLLFKGDNIYRKLFITENKGKIPETIWDNTSNSANASDEIKVLFKNIIFDTAKPIPYILEILKISTQKNDLILDFFAGSGTTGDAVMQLNAEDGGERKYILVQIPEKIDEKKSRVAYDFVKDELGVEVPTIFDITKERLVRAGEKIRKENLEKSENLDLGFKIFETVDVIVPEFEEDEFSENIKMFDENNLSEQDLKNILVTWKTYDGIPLTKDLEEIELGGYTGYYLNNKLYLVDKGFKTKHLTKLLNEIDENKIFNPNIIIAFGYNFESKILRELSENIQKYPNKKGSEENIDFISRY
ncbi:MAG: site-specific DNA-methyltransferase [Candidatus Gracilibacteria bacterium]|nr:site-specific DNA-methyltransferase [Candidatus Gracilibacteria bacterium]MDQ7023719.1 site-specific DNA-methyltransferase [Candidatus Gracilibacteria bacterium]